MVIDRLPNLSERTEANLSCRICGNTEGNIPSRVKEMMFGTRDEFEYFKCARCGCLQIKAIPQNLGDYYPDDYYSFKSYRRLARSRMRRIFDPKRLNYYLTGKGLLGRLAAIRTKPPKYLPWVMEAGISCSSRILDVGSGNGKLLLKMSLAGFRHCTGLDQYLERTIEYPGGVKILKEDLFSFAERTSEKFDLIMFHHSFEHMANPDKILKMAASLLSQSGYILIHLPLSDSYAYNRYGDKWVQLDAPRHLHLHTKDSMELLARGAGLSVEKVLYDSSEFQFIWSELYVRDIPLNSDKETKQILTEKEIRAFRKKAAELNQLGRGDQAMFFMSNRRKEPVFPLSDIQLEEAASLERALWDLDQKKLLRLLNRKKKYPRSNLRRVAEWASSKHQFQSVKGRFYDGTVEPFVNLKTFPEEFNAFLDRVAEGNGTLSKRELIRMLGDGRRGRRTYTQKMLRFVCSNRLLMRIAEWFCHDLEAFVKVGNLSRFKPNQLHGEIIAFLKLLESSRPQTVLEIGTSRGGSLYLFTKVAASDAMLVTVDLSIANKKHLASFKRKQQRITLVEGDSTSQETISLVREIFPEGVDFLFLDGDHAYQGVKKDFENFAPLVRSGGLIAFHDIVEDNDTRYGVSTGGWSGGVPAFWNETKQRFRHVEIIQHPEQDGFGIGVLFVEDPEEGHQN